MEVSPTSPSVWRSRDFRIVMVGGVVNDIGDWMLSLALPVYVFTETGSGRNTALNPAYLMLWGYFGFAVVGWTFINATFVTTALGVYLVLFAFTGVPNATSQIGAQATAQRWCPPEIRGRLAGVMSATGAIGAGIGTVVAGALIDHINIVALFNVQTTMFFLAGIATLLLIVRRLPDDAAANSAREVETVESSLSPS